MRGVRRIEPHRSHEAVAEQLRRQIVLRLVGPEGALPPERELARMFGVGRATVQRALGALEQDGLVERRRGRRGGTFVVGAGGLPRPLERALAAIRSGRGEIEQALEYRLEIEPGAAAAAARARDDDDLARLHEAAARAEGATSDDEFMEADTAFHLALARATRNRFFVDAVERVRVALNDALVALPDSQVWRSWSHREHGRIADAVGAGDEAGARREMRAHVRHTDEAVRALLRSL